MIRKMMRFIKAQFLGIFHYFRHAVGYFVVINLAFSFCYFSILSKSPSFCYDRIETLIHTFAATLTMSAPVFIEVNEFSSNGYGLDLIVLAHLFLAYLFLGVLISLVYRKLTRT